MGGAYPAAQDASAAHRATTPPAAVAEVQVTGANGVAVAGIAEGSEGGSVGAAAGSAAAAPVGHPLMMWVAAADAELAAATAIHGRGGCQHLPRPLSPPSPR